MSLRSLQEIGGRQLGLVTLDQVDRQLTAAEYRTALRRGWLVRVRPRVLAFGGSRCSWHQAVLAAALSAGPSAVASHRSAAALWGFPGFPAAEPTPIDVMVPHGRQPRLGGLRVRTSRILVAHHVSTRDVIPVTSVERTLCDLGSIVSAPRLGRIVDELLVRREVSIVRLRAVHAELVAGARPTRAIGRVLAERGEEWDRAHSRPEATIVGWLREAGLPPPVQQYELGGYQVDAAYPELGVFIEYDGFDGHATRSRFDHDRKRGNVLVLAHGATVLRYTSSSTREEVVREVSAALRRAERPRAG
jgi:very-short-patch-repair endonuclease